MIVTGIRSGIFKYYLISDMDEIRIEEDIEILKPMTMEDISRCAVRVLYKGKKVAVEIFHSLTDGNGGIVFLRSLISEYCSLKYGVQVEYTEKVLDPRDDVKECELRDDYITYASKKVSITNKETVYSVPGEFNYGDKNQIFSKRFKTSELLEMSRSYKTSITTFLTAVMSQTLLDIQTEEERQGKLQKSDKIQIMVPINLRKRFRSTSLRNFVLYALPSVDRGDTGKSIEQIIDKISIQLKEQFKNEHLERMMGVNKRSHKMWIYKYLPLYIKMKLIRIIYRLFGERNSTISVSNFGEIDFPNEVEKYVLSARAILSPRRNAAYNCALLTCNGYTYVDISRKGMGCGLEEIFYEKLLKYKDR